ncbi:MAG: phosphodiester glycosidase family protein [Bacilli bacterium]|nr:phosphodiester glycosidase family protein [Bacilli bacterium]
MNLFKRIYICLLIIMLVLIITPKTLSASNIYSNDDNSATWEVKEQTTKTLNGVTHTYMLGESTDIFQEEIGNQKINVFEMKTDGINSKLVSWAMNSSTTYARGGLSAIAKDYEENHPGWIVVAGINGDQYYTKYGSGLGTDGSFYYYNQPYYPMIIDGERRFPITPTGNSASNYIGIANNNDQESFIEESPLADLKIEILDEKDQIIYIHKVDKINNNPNENETSVWFSYVSAEQNGKYIEHNVKTEKNLYIIEKAELAYMNNSSTYPYSGAADSLFGKGTISLIKNDYVFTSGSFGIETSNSDLIKYLKEKVKVRVQYYYQNEDMNNVEASFGYHSVQRENNQDVKTTAAYDARRYNRSIFGKKADGTYVLMTVAKGTYSGTTQNESNTILKQFGVTDAYQQDGGGSVTAIIRNANDSFDIVNESSDSSVKERQILSGCFFVVRDSGYRSYKKDSTKNSITLTKVNNYNDEYISNVVAELNGKTYNITDEDLIIDNLEYDTEYTIKLTYDINLNGYIVKGEQQVIAHTASFVMPSSGISVKKVTANSIILERISQTEDEVVSAIVTCNNETYDLTEENKEIIIKDLSPSTVYKLQITYSVKDIIDGKIYEGKEEINKITKKYNIPEIIKFEVTNKNKNSIELNVEIIDDFNLSYACYISYNGKQLDCEQLSNIYIIENINLEQEDYEVMLVVLYKENNVYKSLNSDVILIEKIEHVHEFKDGICDCGEKDPIYVPPHVHNFVEGKCECGEVDPNYVKPHTHTFVEGTCECGEIDPTYVAPGDSDPEPAKKKCGKKSGELVIGILSLTAVIGLLVIKRK